MVDFNSMLTLVSWGLIANSTVSHLNSVMCEVLCRNWGLFQHLLIMLIMALGLSPCGTQVQALFTVSIPTPSKVHYPHGKWNYKI